MVGREGKDIYRYNTVSARYTDIEQTIGEGTKIVE
jgi:hypothetical protein